MTVSDLIAELKKMPPEAVVVVDLDRRCGDGGYKAVDGLSPVNFSANAVLIS